MPYSTESKLTDKEKTRLRAICKITNRPFMVLATKPQAARELIAKYQWTQSK